MSEELQYKFLKLSSGDGIICKTTDDCSNLFDKKSISITDPIILNPVRVPRGDVLVESYIMYPMFSFSEEKNYVISTNQIIFAVNVENRLKQNYLQYLKTQEEKEEESDDDSIIIENDDEEENESLFDKLLNALGDEINEENERHDDFATGRTKRNSRILH